VTKLRKLRKTHIYGANEILVEAFYWQDSMGDNVKIYLKQTAEVCSGFNWLRTGSNLHVSVTQKIALTSSVTINLLKYTLYDRIMQVHVKSIKWEAMH
jgi:hypothetical protein